MEGVKRLLILFVILSLFSFFMLSCASSRTKNNGSVATDDDIKAMFESHAYDLKYNYFSTFGRWDRSPAAIVGINKDYVLVKESSYPRDFTNWQQFEPGSEKLKELVEAMDKPTSYGFIIYAPGGADQIGIMYSKKWAIDMPEIRFNDANLIVVKPRTFGSSGFSGAP